MILYKNSILLFFCLSVTSASIAQSTDYNLKKGFVAEGYDVVSYFNDGPAKGSDDHIVEYDGVRFRFSNEENKNAFLNNPEKYIPEYGGWCAYAIAENNSKVDIDPETYEIRDGKLYLFYNAFFNNTLESWLEEGPDRLIPRADSNWVRLKAREE
ncbi:MAG: YHS domain-containing (seleno)protein [Saprospiraceae bacterium]|nr:YHS domain-containing (seleno)protein [Saprospiraceae bacterium]